MKVRKPTPSCVQKLADKLTELTRLGKLEWTRTVTNGEDGHRAVKDNVWANIRKIDGSDEVLFHISGRYGGTPEYSDGEDQGAITILFKVITTDEENEKLDYHESRGLLSAMVAYNV